MDAMAQRLGRPPILHPVLMATPVVIAIVVLSRSTSEVYAASTAMLSFLPGPTVVAMAVPLWAQRYTIRRRAVPISLALLAGGLTAIVTSVGIVWMFGAMIATPILNALKMMTGGRGAFPSASQPMGQGRRGRLRFIRWLEPMPGWGWR